MHRFQFSVVDDGTNSGPFSEVIHLKLSTLDDTVVSDQDWSEVCSEISDHRAGTFHECVFELRLDDQVWDVLGRNCLPPPG